MNGGGAASGVSAAEGRGHAYCKPRRAGKKEASVAQESPGGRENPGPAHPADGAAYGLQKVFCAFDESDLR